MTYGTDMDLMRQVEIFKKTIMETEDLVEIALMLMDKMEVDLIMQVLVHHPTDQTLSLIHI